MSLVQAKKPTRNQAKKARRMSQLIRLSCPRSKCKFKMLKLKSLKLSRRLETSKKKNEMKLSKRTEVNHINHFLVLRRGPFSKSIFISFGSLIQSNDVRLKYMELLDNQLKEQKTLIKMLEKNKLSHAARQGVLDTLKQLTNSIDQRRSSIKALEHDMELSQRRLAKVRCRRL